MAITRALRRCAGASARNHGQGAQWRLLTTPPCGLWARRQGKAAWHGGGSRRHRRPTGKGGVERATGVDEEHTGVYVPPPPWDRESAPLCNALEWIA